ncbi:hypothetical protein N7476_006489 [Penicillium atrosanguineum]|uniref:FAD-binding domain-containing protein n=1 Tax=Penicillium atrosanguineum TaxID=1132637 RepID=A0A9W9PX94_9EURO|nr:hypothetical protein N7526_011322 [Penicillium atrosanguineum]KAJ5316182.1 hypothetical protein N7476_006489 [Penicillium atrosanguineum]
MVIEAVEAGPLKVLIVGAGLGGLAAAIALRRQGHDVHVFEKSRFISELGAAINVPPNAYGVLLHLGVDPAKDGAVEMRYITEYDKSGVHMKVTDFATRNNGWQHSWLLAHRVDLHSQLKEAAGCHQGVGNPAKIHTSSMVINVDMESATITLEDGTTVSGDVVIGADGIHSRSRVGLTEERPFPSGKSAYRFLLKKKDVWQNPKLRNIVRTEGNLAFWFGTDRRIIMYPTRKGDVFNFVCIYPDQNPDPVSGAWDDLGHQVDLLKAFEGFDSRVLELLKMADPATLKVWRLMDMGKISCWTKGHFALLGDAAHPFLPHQGQGGAQAIEDAVCLGVLLPIGTKRYDVPARLQLYQEIRKERAEKVQSLTRLSGEDVRADSSNNLEKVMEHFVFNVAHDEHHNSVRCLRQWMHKRSPAQFWRMPVSFGPSPGPRQDFLGQRYDTRSVRYVTTTFKFKTSRTLLQNFFPTQSYRFRSVDTVAYASLSHTAYENLSWLGGRGYDFLSLGLHGVQYIKQDGTVLNGTFLPVVFENLADPILTGREELGWPKIFAEIDVKRTSNSFSMNANWRGASFATFELSGLYPVDDGPLEDEEGIFVHKYIPATGMKGVADADYSVYTPKALLQIGKCLRATKGAISFNSLDWEALPTMHHIVKRLEELPVIEFVEGVVVEGEGISDLQDTFRIE